LSLSHSNAWSNPSAISAEDAARMAAFLEDRARCPDQVQVNTAVRDVLALRPGERLLEVGCGSGALCRLMVPALHPSGEIIGLDVAPDMIAAARHYAAEAAVPNVAEHPERSSGFLLRSRRMRLAPTRSGLLRLRPGPKTAGTPLTRSVPTLPANEELGERAALRFEVGPAEALPYADGAFDAAFAARLLLHVADPLAVVREMARVVRPGGRVVLMDWDWGTLAVAHTDRALTRRLMDWRCDNHGGDNWSGRKLLDVALAAGLTNVAVTPVATLARDETAALTGSIFRAAEVARNGGAITPAEHDAWVGELRQRLVEGRFVASLVYFVARGEVGGK
jgi:ubiquinone/menaquinone biosynthesis C-methylase UbiE